MRRFSRLPVALALAATLLGGALLAQGQVPPLTGPEPEVIPGGWVVRERVVREDAELFVRGNLTIERGGSLELHHSKLVLGRPNQKWGIPVLDIKPGGSLRLLATANGGSTLTSNESWIMYKVNGTLDSLGLPLQRNLIEWIWGQTAVDTKNNEIVPTFPDGGSRSGIRLDGGGRATVTHTDVRLAGIRHFIVADGTLTLEHVTLHRNDPALTAVKVVQQGVAAARGSTVTLRDVTVEHAHTALYVIDAKRVLVERSTLEGGAPLGGSATSAVALQAKRGTVEVRDSTLTSPESVVLLESNATLLVTDSTLGGYANIGLSALGLKASSPFAGSPTVTLRRVAFEPGPPAPTQNGIQTVFGARLVVENSDLSGHASSGLAAVNTTTRLVGNTLHANREWGAWLHGGVLEHEEGNDFGALTGQNRFGRILKDLTLYVRVLDANGKPVSNATVRATNAAGEVVFEDVTRGPNPDDPRGKEKEGWLMDSHYLLGFRVLNDGTREDHRPYTVEASKRGLPTKTVVLDDLRWQRIGIRLEGVPGPTEPIVGGKAVENPFEEKAGFLGDDHDHSQHGSALHRFLNKVPGPGFALAALALLGALLVRQSAWRG